MGECFSAQDSNTSICCCILGNAGSGKSTFIKQLRLIDNQPWTPTQLATSRILVRQHLLKGLQELIAACVHQQLEFQPANVKPVRILQETDANVDDLSSFWSEDANCERLDRVWGDPAIQKCYAEGNTIYRSLDYFIDRLEEIRKTDYSPSDDDILRIRMRTTCVAQTTVNAGNKRWHLTDCGGQPKEREKWPAILESQAFSTLLYFVALDEFNIMSSEEPTKSKMQVSVEAFEKLFTHVVKNSKQSYCIILFLNKLDLFMPKYKESSELFKEIYPEYQGVSYLDAIDFIISLYSVKLPTKFIMCAHTITALDKNLTDKVFRTVQKWTLTASLQQANMV